MNILFVEERILKLSQLIQDSRRELAKGWELGSLYTRGVLPEGITYCTPGYNILYREQSPRPNWVTVRFS
jgi:hypothetical protein